jgi:diacylglycerol kinase (ATP)
MPNFCEGNGMRLGLVVNPTAGKGKAHATAPTIESALRAAGHDLVQLSADSYQQALKNAKDAIKARRIDGLIVAGGDGMAHLAANVCAETAVPFGLLPVGTGNDSARALGMPLGNLSEALTHLVERLSAPRTIDVMRVSSSAGEFYSCGSVSAGFDALVNQRANSWVFPKGPSRYQLAMVAELANFKPIRYRLLVDGQKREFKAMLCAVANAASFGGGMLIAPEAKVDDGELDLFIVHEISRPELIRVFPKVYTGAHVTHPAVELVRAKSIHLEAAQMPAFADGEAVGHAPLSITVVPGGLRVFA